MNLVIWWFCGILLARCLAFFRRVLTLLMSCSDSMVVVFVMEDLLGFVDVFVILARRTFIAGVTVTVTVTVGSG